MNATDLSFWELIFTGNWIALGVLLLLLGMSAWSWAIIMVKSLQLRQVNQRNRQFLAYFQSHRNIGDTLKIAKRLSPSPLAKLFVLVINEIGHTTKENKEGKDKTALRKKLLEIIDRRLEGGFHQENENLEKRLYFLALVSSSAPYIGLFGTVLGIIDAFRQIAQVGVTSLAVVAPGISEALVATAAGLVAAIPSLIAYNSFRQKLREINVQMKSFSLDLMNRMESFL